jgi:hypothetical protein
MSKTFKIHISNPCHEDWQNMTPDDLGRFCQSCEKSVIDFTTMPDYDIISFFKNNPKGVCGRFSNNQLDKEYSFPSGLKSTNYARVAALLAGLFVTNIGCQNLPPQLNNKDLTELVNGQNTFPKNPKIIKGQVINEDSLGLMGVEITVQNSAQKTYSDVNGNFQLIVDGDTSGVKVNLNAFGFKSDSTDIIFKTNSTTDETIVLEMKSLLNKKSDESEQDTILTGDIITLSVKACVLGFTNINTQKE